MGDRRTQPTTDSSATARKVGHTKRHQLRFHFLLLCLLMFPLSIVSVSPLNFTLSVALAQTTQDRKAEADRLLKQGYEYNRKEQYQTAIQSFQQALFLYKTIGDRQGEGSAAFLLGAMYSLQANYDKALEYGQFALLIAREFHNPDFEGVILRRLGNVYNSLGETRKAIEYHQQSLAIFQELKERSLEGQVLQSLGGAYSDLEDYSKAFEAYQKSLEIARALQDYDEEAGLLDDLGGVYNMLGDYNKAIEYHQRGLALAQKIKSRRLEAHTLNNLGLAYIMRKTYAEAIKAFQQSLAIKSVLKDHVGEVSSLMGIGNAYLSLGNYAKAIEYEQQALTIAREIKDRQGEGKALGNLGIAYLSLGNYAKAIEYEQQWLTIAQVIGDRESEGIALNNIGITLEKQQQLELAILFFKQSVNMRESIKQTNRLLSRELQESYTKTVADTYRRLANLLLSKGDILGAQQVLELLKVQELREFDNATRARISSTGKVDLDPVEQTIIDQYGSYITFNQKLWECEHQQPRCGDYDGLNKLWKANKQEYDSAVAALAADVQRRKAQDEQNVLDPKNELSRKAAEILKDDKTALVYFFVTDQRVWIILATRGEALRPFEVAVDRKTLSTQVVAFRQLMEACQSKVCTTADTERLQAVSQKLYGWLFPAPLQQELKGRMQHLVFSLDRNLRYIPMSALYDGKHYLIEDYAVSTIAAAKFNDIDPFQDGDLAVKVLAAGFSDRFPPDFPYPLTNVPLELSAIVQSPNQNQSGVYPGTILLNQTFSLDNLQKDLPNNRILHIATHGEFVPSGQGSSYILSGDKRKIDIHQIDDLRGIGELKLVVLSACQTALGKEGQDGVEINSLGFSFLEKGAKSVMASLWNVSDISTSLLMQQFYQNLAQKTPTTRAEALRQAQLRFLRGDITVADGDRLRARADPKVGAAKKGDRSPDFKHPYYWSPFILIGSGF